MAKYEGQEEAVADPSEIHADYDISDEYPADYDESAQQNEAPSKNVLPMRYADAATSGFVAEVSEGENTHDFDLES